MRSKGLLAARRKRFILGFAALLSLVSCLGASQASATSTAGAVSIRLQPGVVEYGPASVSLSGISTNAVSVRLRGADDPAGLAYKWTPYPWRRLRLVRGKWRGALPAPPLRGIYQLQFRIQHRGRLLQSPHWLLRALPADALKRPAFASPEAVIRNYVGGLPGDEVLVTARARPQAAFDHRDPRLHRLFVIAYEHRGDNRPGDRLGLFISTFRDGYHGRWRLLEATSGPYE